jgi:hypothetical protein
MIPVIDDFPCPPLKLHAASCLDRQSRRLATSSGKTNGAMLEQWLTKRLNAHAPNDFPFSSVKSAALRAFCLLSQVGERKLGMHEPKAESAPISERHDPPFDVYT